VTEFNIEAVMKLKEMGIHVEYFQQLGEGCSALDLVPSTFLKGLDQCALTRWYVQALAVQKGMEVEFKTPAFTIPMCETSVHFSLWNTERNRNLFFDADDEMELSGTAKHFIAGIMHYFKELTTIMQLSGDRSYPRNWRRFHSASRDEAIVHVPVYLKERKKLDRVGWGKRILFNGFLNPCNLHLCTAAVMLAGLEGVRNKWNPEEEENKTEQTAPPDRSIFDGDNIFRKVLGDDYLAFVLRQDTIC
jgi:glutamine synthetase